MVARHDLELLDCWCAGDQAAGSELFARHFDTLYRFFEHKVEGDADDLVQETLLACVRSRDGFRRQSTFRTYLFAIARNTLYDHWARRFPAGRTEDVAALSIASLSTSVGTRMTRRHEQARLIAALRKLPLDQQLLLELHYWEDLDGQQLAEVFGTAPATSRSRLFRARAALRDCLAALPPDVAAVPDNDLDQRGGRLLSDVANPDDTDA